MPNMKITLLASAGEKHYQLALLQGLLDQNLKVEFIGNDRMAQSDIFRKNNNVTLFHLRGAGNSDATLSQKIIRTLKYYYRLTKYAASTDSPLFHIQWRNRFVFLDRTLLNIYYKLLGKKLVFTAHNVDVEARENRSGFFNRLSLKCMYCLMDHIIVHTEKMKKQLIEWFKISHGWQPVEHSDGLPSGRDLPKRHVSAGKQSTTTIGSPTPCPRRSSRKACAKCSN